MDDDTPERPLSLSLLGRGMDRLLRSAKGSTQHREPLPASATVAAGQTTSRPGTRTAPRLMGSSRPSTSRFLHTTDTRRNGDLPAWLRKAGLGSWALIGLVIVISASVFALARVSAVFTAMFVALLLTAILNPVVNLLDRWVNRWVAVLVALLGFFGLFMGLMTLVVTSVVGQWPKLTDQFGNGIDIIIDFLRSTPFHITLTQEDVSTWLDQMVDNAQSYLATNWSRLAGDLLSNVSSVALAFTVMALSVFVTVFFLHSGTGMWRWFLNMLPARRRDNTHRAASAGWYTFSGYARGTMIIAATDGILAGVFLQLLGVPVAPALGVLVFIGAFIPLIGAPTAMVVAMVVALAADGILKAAIVGLGIAAIGQLEGHILQPLIMGHQVSLHPVVVGVGVAVGTFTAGLLGAVIAIPIIGVIWAVFAELHEPDPPIEGPLPDYLGARKRARNAD